MNVSVNDTPFCYTINNPPFNYTHPIASAYYPFIFMTLGLTSNLIALVVLVKSFRTTQSRSRSSFLIFLGGLVVTDFMGLLVTGCIVGTFHVTHFNWRTLDPHCHFCNFMGMTMVFYGLCPLLLGATMAVERFIGITMPFVRSFSKKRGRTIYIVLSVWTFAGSIALLPVLGVGSFHLQKPGSWCFINISPEGTDMVFSLIFSLTGLTCITVSFLLNTVSLVTLIRVCCGHDRKQRRRDYEIEMMVQLILIMVIASICWCPLLINTLLSIVTMVPVRDEIVLFCIRMATCNQIFDPWIYIVCQVPCLRRVKREKYIWLWPF
ncbi:thromboxane A2 receptor isoform X3 [Cynoglossus semilaevis]|uniref:thromboxane A2 receptor isoform X3 n=1 Tax=Cynoglossus semilaevis TaxID=244447 RepID=UPI00049846DF|nr:thromboxane A2 receptor isoform X3 [Cynoglossus semilaevis]